MSQDLSHCSEQLIALAKQAGACHADALSVLDVGASVQVRHGTLESVEREESRGIGLRAFVHTKDGLAFASASSSDVSQQGLQDLATQVVTMANISQADPDSIPPEGAKHPSADMMQAWEHKHPHQPHGWDTEQAIDAAMRCEQAALDEDDAIANSEGAHAAFGAAQVAYAASDGFVASYQQASSSLSVSVIAGEGEGMQRDYAYSRSRRAEDLRAPDGIGREAAQRAVRMLGASDVSSRKTTVVFEPRVATSLLGHLISAVNGRSILRQQSFLADALEQRIFPDFVHLVDDPDHAVGMGNRLFDAEGLCCQRLPLVESGVLHSFLTDRYAAKRLKHPETGHARRGLTGDTGIGTSNIILQAGQASLDEMCRDIGQGILVTELMGFGVNAITGDYSRGAAGFLIEQGIITRPIQGFTIAGNLKDMFAGITHLGSDQTWFGSMATPSIAIADMTIAGQS